jgi:hypothetical protein
MRLTQREAQDIARPAHHMAGDAVCVRVLGSRVDDKRQGCDIDLNVETRDADFLRELRCRIAIEEAVDLVSAVFPANQPRTAYALSATVR